MGTYKIWAMERSVLATEKFTSYIRSAQKGLFYLGYTRNITKVLVTGGDNRETSESD
jgi:L-lysine 2,3-aminomutase